MINFNVGDHVLINSSIIDKRYNFATIAYLMVNDDGEEIAGVIFWFLDDISVPKQSERLQADILLTDLRHAVPDLA